MENAYIEYDESKEIRNNLVKEDLAEAISHGIFVSNLAVLLARELGESESFCSDIAMAGVLHDIGKVKIGKYLYGKREDTLLIEERRFVRMHSAYSYNILRKRNFSLFVLEMIYHHHENYDGSGYPNNLKGEDIPLGARILRICDVFGALISDRPYRAAFDADTAIQVMIDEVKNFDMRIFLAFQRMIHSEEFKKVEGLNNKDDILNKINQSLWNTDTMIKARYGIS